MADNLPGYSRDRGAGKPLTRAEFAKRERERKAVDLYTKKWSFPAVKKALNLRSNEAAEELVRAGWERYRSEEDYWGPLYRKTMREDLRELHGILMDESRGGNLAAMDRLMKIMERAAKLDDLDKGKDSDDAGGNTYIIQAGGDISLVPPGGQALDVRAPWEREVIDGEAEDDEPPAPPASG